MTQTKRFLTVLFIIIWLLCAVSCFSRDVQTAQEGEMNAVLIHADQYLEEARMQLVSSCNILGFDRETFLNMTVGKPIRIYTFDGFGDVLSDDVYSCPLFYQDNIVGIIGVYYDLADQQYHCSLGKMYADKLNEIWHSDTLSYSEGFIIGQLYDKLFITDGKEVEVIFDEEGEHTRSISVEELKELCPHIAENVDDRYFLSKTTTPESTMQVR